MLIVIRNSAFVGHLVSVLLSSLMASADIAEEVVLSYTVFLGAKGLKRL